MMMMMMMKKTLQLLPLLPLLLVASAATATATATATAISDSELNDSSSSFESSESQQQQQSDDTNTKQSRELQGEIKDKWSIFDPPIWTYADLDFFIEIQVSNYIIPGQANVEIYSYDTCKDDGPSGLPGSGTLQTIGFVNNPQPDIDYTGVDNVSVLYSDPAFNVIGKTIKIPISMDSATIGTNNDVYSTYEDENGNTQGQMKFCVRYSLRTLNPIDPVEMNFREVLVTLDVKLSPNEFALITNADVIFKEADQFQENDLDSVFDGIVFDLDGYICNPIDGTPLDSSVVKIQGELIDICVKPTAVDRAKGIVMRSINSFTWTRNDASETRTQIAIENNGQISSNGLTSYNASACILSEYCSFNTFLSSPFYFNGQGIVGGSGTASMVFQGNGNNGRQLRSRNLEVHFNMNAAKRSLQDDNNNNNNGDGLFDLQVNIAGMDYNSKNNNNNDDGQTAAGSVVASLSTAIAAAIAIVIVSVATAFA
jgi:hypothetical protein